MNARDVATVVDKIRPLLAGLGPDIQGAVLAELLAMWLAGHVVPGDPDATFQLRDDLLLVHCEFVLRLVPIKKEKD